MKHKYLLVKHKINKYFVESRDICNCPTKVKGGGSVCQWLPRKEGRVGPRKKKEGGCLAEGQASSSQAKNIF